MFKKCVWVVLALTFMVLPPAAAQEGGAVITPENAAQLTQVGTLGYGEIYEAAYSPDGTYLAISSTSGVRLLDGTTLNARDYLQLPAESEALLRWAGQTLFIGIPAGAIFEWTPGASELTPIADYAGKLMDFAPAPDGSKLAVLVDELALEVYDRGSGQSTPYYTALGETILDFAWSPDGKTLAYSTENGKLFLNSETVLTGLEDVIVSLVWSPDGTQIAAVGVRRRQGTPIFFYDPLAGTVTTQADLPRRTDGALVFWVAGQEADRLLYSDGNTEITDYFTNTILNLAEPPLIGFRAVSASATGTRLAGFDGSRSGFVNVYDLTTGAAIGTIGGMYPVETVRWQDERLVYGHFSPIYIPLEMVVWQGGVETYHLLDGADEALLSPALDRVALLQRFGPVPARLHNLTSGIESDLTTDPTYRALAWSPDGQWMLMAHQQRDANNFEVLEIFDVTTGTVVRSLDGTMNRAAAAVWSPDGTRVSVVDVFDLNAVIWDTTTGERLSDVPMAIVVGWSRGGEYVIIQRSTLEIWDAQSFQPIADLAFGTHTVLNPLLTPPVWSPDGTQFAVISTDNGLMVWDSASGETRAFGPMQDFGLAWSPDGRLLAAFDATNQLSLWDATNGAALVQIPAPEGYDFTTLTFASDGTGIAAGTQQGVVFVYGIE